MEHKTEMLSGIAHFDGLSKSTRISGQDSAGQDSSSRLAGPTNHPLEPRHLATLQCTVEVRSKGQRVVWRKMMGKEHQTLGGRDGKMVGKHQIESSSYHCLNT